VLHVEFISELPVLESFVKYGTDCSISTFLPSTMFGENFWAASAIFKFSELVLFEAAKNLFIVPAFKHLPSRCFSMWRHTASTTGGMDRIRSMPSKFVVVGHVDWTSGKLVLPNFAGADPMNCIFDFGRRRVVLVNSSNL